MPFVPMFADKNVIQSGEGHNTHSKPTMIHPTPAKMLTLQRALERVESNKRGQQIQSPTVRLKIKQL